MSQLNPIVTQTVGSEMGPMQSQIDQIMVSKPVYLSNPGSVVVNALYYGSHSTTLDIAESVQNFGRYTVSLTSSAFGGIGNATIPVNNFLSNCYLLLQLPALPANTFVPRGWGYRAIRNISFLMGSSNVSQLNITGDSHFQQTMLACETVEKRSEALSLGGQQINTNGAEPLGTVHYAYVHLSLPFSRLNALMKKLPFDTNLLMNPIIIQIQFGSISDIMDGSGVPSVTFPGFTVANVITNQIELADKSLSFRNYMLFVNQNAIYDFPFIFSQSLAPPAQTSLALGQSFQFSLNTLLNADLVGISFGLINTQYQPVSNSSVGYLSPFRYDAVTDITLSYNGQVLYFSPGESYQVYDLCDSFGGSNRYQNSVPDVATIGPGGITTTPIPVIPEDDHIVYISFTRIKSIVFHDYYQNSFRLPNQTLNLQLTPSAPGTYQLYVTYYYNAAFAVEAGQTRLIIA